ncbi:MAG: 5'-nucleotidase C-terminal domain-containing protein, partial [Gemmatimonadota bacterium]
MRTELVFLGTTDVHNWIYPYDYYTRSEVGYGLARLKPVIDSVRAANPSRTYLFDSGDLLQGNPLGSVHAKQLADQPNPVVHAMNLLGYNAAAIGNHEYNYGIPHLERAVAQAKFPFISGNTFRHGSTQHAFTPYVLIPHVAGAGDTVLIGVTGNTPPGVHVWDKANVEGRLQFRNVVASLKPIVAEMKSRGADVVVVLSHGGFQGTSYDTASTGLPEENAGARLAQEVPDIDVVFLGHTHQQVRDTTINGVLFTQAGQWAQALAHARLVLEKQAPNRWRAVQKSALLLRPDSLRADTVFLDSMRWEHERTVEYVKSVVGRGSVRMSAAEARTKDTPIGDFINEMQRRRAGADLSSTAIHRLSAALPQGPITVADLAGLYIYDNTLKAVRINGTQLKEYLERSSDYFRTWPVPAGEKLINPNSRSYNFDVVQGVDYTIDLTKPVGTRITGLRFKGRPVTPAQTFTLALNNYRQSGGGGFTMVANAPVVYDKQEGIRELLIEEVQKRGSIRPQDYFQQNWRIVPEAAARAAQAELAPETRIANTSAQMKRVRIIGQNDFHGRLQPEVYSWSNGKPIGGAAVLYSYYKHERAAFDGPTITLDGGDVMQGTPISNLTEGRSTVEFFNRNGVDVAAIGNHDFDWGLSVLQPRMQQARFAWLGANIYTAGANAHPSWARGTVMLERGGVKVGVIGLSTEETPSVTKADNVKGLEFRSGAAEINRLVPLLRRQGADFVIVTAHSGVVCDRGTMVNCHDEMIDWARQVTEKPDLIVAGHTHQYINIVENGIRIVEGWDYSKLYSVVDLEKTADGRTKVWVRGQPITWHDRVKPDSGIAAMVKRYEQQIGPRVNRIIATLAEPLRKSGGEYALGHLIADAQRAAAGAQVTVMNNGGIRTDLEAGPLTWGELYQLQPFANRIIRLTLSGTILKELMEFVVAERQPRMHVSGITVSYDTSAAPGSRLRRMQLSDGQDVQDSGSYQVGVNDFMAGGGDGLTMLLRADAKVDVGV